jgi:HEAT repeat protein
VELAMAIVRIERHTPGEIMPCLLESLKDTDGRVRCRAVEVIGLFCSLHKAPDTEKPAVSLEGATDAMARALTDSDDDVREAALLAFVAAVPGNARSVKALMEVAKGGDPYRRRLAVTALGHSGPAAKAAVPLLEEMAGGDASRLVRLHAACALWKLGKERDRWLVAIIDRLLNDPDAELRFEALMIIHFHIAISDPSVVNALRKVISEDDNENCRRIAKSTLKIISVTSGFEEKLDAIIKDAKP